MLCWAVRSVSLWERRLYFFLCSSFAAISVPLSRAGWVSAPSVRCKQMQIRHNRRRRWQSTNLGFLLPWYRRSELLAAQFSAIQCCDYREDIVRSCVDHQLQSGALVLRPLVCTYIRLLVHGQQCLLYILSYGAAGIRSGPGYDRGDFYQSSGPYLVGGYAHCPLHGLQVQ